MAAVEMQIARTQFAAACDRLDVFIFQGGRDVAPVFRARRKPEQMHRDVPRERLKYFEINRR